MLAWPPLWLAMRDGIVIATAGVLSARSFDGAHTATGVFFLVSQPLTEHTFGRIVLFPHLMLASYFPARRAPERSS